MNYSITIHVSACHGIYLFRQIEKIVSTLSKKILLLTTQILYFSHIDTFGKETFEHFCSLLLVL